MKKIVFYILITLITSYNCTYSADTTSCKFFPMHVGDFYVYQVINKTTSYPPPVNTCDTIYKYARITDFITINNQKYFKCSNFFFDSYFWTYYLRYDSLTGYLKGYDSSSVSCNYEKTFYKLSANLNDTLGVFCTHLINYNYQYCDLITTINCFGFQTISKSFYSQRLYTITDIGNLKFAKYFGIHYATDHSSYSIPGHIGSNDNYYFLIGAKINGIVYGDTNTVNIINCSSNLPSSFYLSQNYPNPFNPNTIIRYQINELSSPHALSGDLVLLKIYDILGKEIATLVNEKQSPGTYEVNWDASAFPSGVYFYKLTAGDFTETKKMLFIK
jgi:hypothetical protein